MRKLILACIALFTVVLAEAQIEKGDIQLGGSVQYVSTENGGIDQSTLIISPQAGLFVSPTTSIGLILAFNSQTFPGLNQNNGQLVDLTSNLFQFGAYARFHKPVADNFYLFLQPSVRFGSGSTEQINNPDVDVNTFGINASPGMTYFLSPKFALEMTVGNIGYGSQTADINGTEQKTNNFVFNMNLAQVGLGLNFFIK